MSEPFLIKETAKLSDIIEITDFEDPKLDVYARTKEIQLLNRANPEDGIFIAESPKVVERALDAGYEPISILVEKKHVEGEAKQIHKTLWADPGDIRQNLMCSQRSPVLN